MKVYKAVLDLYEDGPLYLGTFDSREKAEKAVEEDKEESIMADGSYGPNVIDYRIIEVEVK